MSSRVLDEVRVATPCGVSWDEMVGTQRVRYCHHCRMNVYNLSAMSREDAEVMIQGREGRLCVRFYRRADGTMITQDCPVGLQGARWAIHRGWVLLTASLVSVLAVFFAVAAVTPVERRGQWRNFKDWLFPPAALVEVDNSLPVIPSEPPVCVMGDIAPPAPRPVVESLPELPEEK